MVKSNVINVLYRGGAKQEVVCLNPDEAASVWLQISEAMIQGLPVVAIEDSATAIAISTAEIASVSIGVETAHARIEQVPQRERPRPQPVPARVERGTLIAN